MGNIVVNSIQGAIFANLNATVYSSRNLFGYSRDEIEVELFSGSSTAPSYFSPYDYHIHINDNTASGDVWGSSGVFTVAHEYGHAVMWSLYTGLPLDNCPSPHYVNASEDRTCAWVEGWADYHAVAVRGSASALYPEFESNFYFQPGTDGTTVEGVVAAFLADITDQSADSPNDDLGYPGSYLLNVVKTCRVSPNGGATPIPNTVDDVIYCLEDQVDATARNTFFPYSTVTSESNSATKPSTWSQSSIRSLWKAELFGQ